MGCSIGSSVGSLPLSDQVWLQTNTSRRGCSGKQKQPLVLLVLQICPVSSPWPARLVRMDAGTECRLQGCKMLLLPPGQGRPVPARLCSSLLLPLRSRLGSAYLPGHPAVLVTLRGEGV